MELQSEQTAELFAAISKMQGALGHAPKDGKNPHFDSTFATLESVIDASKKALADNNLSVIQTMARIDQCLVLLTTLAHSSGQWIRSFTPIMSEKQNAQGMGSGISYARRFAYAAICGLAQTDDDGNEASKPGPMVQPERVPVTRQAPVGSKQTPPARSASRGQACEHCGKAMMVDRLKPNNWYCIPCKHHMPMMRGA